MINQDNLKEVLLNWNFEEVLRILNDEELDPQDFVISGKTDVLNEFISRKYGAYVNIILDGKYDYLKNGFNYLETAVSVVNKQNKNFDVCKKLIKVVPVSEFNRNNTITGTSPWLKCFENGFLTPAEKMNARGADWKNINNLGQNCVMLYLRNNHISDMFLKFLIANKNKIDVEQKDIWGISLRDILNSASCSEDWMSKENNRLLLAGLEI